MVDVPLPRDKSLLPNFPMIPMHVSYSFVQNPFFLVNINWTLNGRFESVKEMEAYFFEVV